MDADAGARLPSGLRKGMWASQVMCEWPVL
jgi:hypothetical protein